MLDILRVDGRRGTARFVDVPFRLHSGPTDLWTPPLRMTVRDQIDDRRNPFYRDADRALFVAERRGRPVGRVAAIENRWHNRHHTDRVGFFGFFDCADDAEVAQALLTAAEGWLAERGRDVARGPISPSMNHECGLLVEGFDVPAVMMTPWNSPYLPALVESAGYTKAQDLLGYYMPSREKLAVPERMQRLAERTRRKTSVTFRELDLRLLEKEARKVRDLYCDAWAGNWGFVPPSWEEFWHTAKNLKAVLATRYSFVAEVDGEIVGFLMVAKDINRLLRKMPSGRLWPWNVIRLLAGTPRVSNHRVVLLGLKREYRNRGLMSLLAYEAAKRGLEAGVEGGEASWILEDNMALVGPLTSLGFEPYKRWRIYEKPLTGSQRI
jgi:GNAT superfamily N-acetyltransferase